MRKRVRTGLSPFLENDRARDLIARARAALSDDHVEGALRSLGELHALVVPHLDRLLPAPGPGAAALSAGTGFLGLWRELFDADIERESIPELILFYAATLADEELPGDAPLFAGGSEAEQEAQWRYLADLLRRQPRPRADALRRLVRGAEGGLGDRARIEVRRGDRIVFEREPGTGDDGADPSFYHTHLGEFLTGDQLRLILSVPLPGRVAVLSALGTGCAPDQGLALDVEWPLHPGEEAPRRALETIEVSGELSAVPGAAEQSLLCVWAPEELPASFALQVAARCRLPPEARLWRYSYRVREP